jgi:hyperosmotically inducible protein
MKYSTLPVLSLATVLLACAHDPASQQHASTANAEQRAEASHEHREGAAERAENQGVEPVAVPQRGTDRDRVASNDTTLPAASTGHAADNTGVNERDRGGANVTPMDQGNGEVDLDLTQRIRKAVMADDSLSFTAKNAKIITRDGRVTLRGSVKNAAEKEAIYKCAVSAAGVAHVTNELEVDAK